MKQIEYLIKTLSPIVLAEKNNDSTLYNTKKYISGSIFRGMLAGKFIKDKNLGDKAHQNQEFYDIFLANKVRFLPAYPIGKNIIDNLEPYILPLSLMKNKKGTIIKDISDGEKIETGFKKMTGFALKKGNDIYKVNIDTQIEFHMSRNGEKSRILGSDKEGKVFNYEYIEPHQYFKGYVIVDDDIADNVYTYLQKTAKDNIYIGRSRSVQYGKCSLDILAMKSIFIDKLNKDKKFYLYAYTPYIPTEQWNRVDNLAENLCEKINKKLSRDDIKIQKGDLIYATTEEYSGYVGVWHLRRERKMALSAGSMIEFRADNIDDNLIEKLNEILYTGLGDRKEEGFGQFRLMQPMQGLSFKELDENIKVNTQICDEVKKQAKQIIKQRIFEEIKKQAVNDLENKAKFISKSKTTLNRIEDLVNSNKTKQQIQKEIQDFNKSAKDNLENMFLNKDNFLEVLTEDKNVKLPYSNIEWKNSLIVNKEDLKILQDMEKDLGKDIFVINKDDEYKQYFLWFVRHAKKIISKKNKEV